MISGKSANREEILKDFREGKYKVLCNAMLLTEGWDCPEVDCVIVLRPTRSDALYRQMVGRGCRTATNKKDLLLLDFLWLTKKIDLMHPTDLLDCDDEISKRMKKRARKGKAKDLFDLEQDAEKDYQAEIEENLRKELEEAKKAAELETRFVKSEQFIREIGKMYSNVTLKQFVDRRDVKPKTIEVTPYQAATLYGLGLNAGEVDKLTHNAAGELIAFLKCRKRFGKCSYKQARVLYKNGYEPELYSINGASQIISKIFKDKGYNSKKGNRSAKYHGKH